MKLRLGQHLVVGWRSCGESGQIRLEGQDAALRVSDAARTGKGSPLLDLRLEAVRAGTATVTGEGPHGTGEVQVRVSD